jgi:hypothetical protein
MSEARPPHTPGPGEAGTPAGPPGPAAGGEAPGGAAAAGAPGAPEGGPAAAAASGDALHAAAESRENVPLITNEVLLKNVKALTGRGYRVLASSAFNAGIQRINGEPTVDELEDIATWANMVGWDLEQSRDVPNADEVFRVYTKMATGVTFAGKDPESGKALYQNREGAPLNGSTVKLLQRLSDAEAWVARLDADTDWRHRIQNVFIPAEIQRSSAGSHGKQFVADRPLPDDFRTGLSANAIALLDSPGARAILAHKGVPITDTGIRTTRHLLSLSRGEMLTIMEHMPDLKDKDQEERRRVIAELQQKHGPGLAEPGGVVRDEFNEKVVKPWQAATVEVQHTDEAMLAWAQGRAKAYDGFSERLKELIQGERGKALLDDRLNVMQHHEISGLAVGTYDDRVQRYQARIFVRERAAIMATATRLDREARARFAEGTPELKDTLTHILELVATADELASDKTGKHVKVFIAKRNEKRTAQNAREYWQGKYVEAGNVRPPELDAYFAPPAAPPDGEPAQPVAPGDTGDGPPTTPFPAYSGGPGGSPGPAPAGTEGRGHHRHERGPSARVRLGPFAARNLLAAQILFGGPGMPNEERYRTQRGKPITRGL